MGIGSVSQDVKDIIIRLSGEIDKSLESNIRKATRSMGELSDATTRNRTGLDILFAGTQQASVAMKKAANEAKRFKGEYLTLMFTGMLLSRTFGSITQRFWDNVGATEALRDVVDEAMLNVFSPFGEFMTDLIFTLGDSTIGQGFISAITVMGSAAGTAMFSIGQIGLFLNGLAKFGIDDVASAKEALNSVFNKAWVVVNKGKDWIVKVATAGINATLENITAVRNMMKQLPKAHKIIISVGFAFLIIEAAKKLVEQINILAPQGLKDLFTLMVGFGGGATAAIAAAAPFDIPALALTGGSGAPFIIGKNLILSILGGGAGLGVAAKELGIGFQPDGGFSLLSDRQRELQNQQFNGGITININGIADKETIDYAIRELKNVSYSNPWGTTPP